MNDEQQFNEIEKTMFDLSGACRRARKTIAALEKGQAPEHLIEAMRATLAEMEDSHKRLILNPPICCERRDSGWVSVAWMRSVG